MQHDVNVEEKGLPPLLRCTGQKMQEAGIYIVGKLSILNHRSLYLYPMTSVIGFSYSYLQ